jgi:hypothetical protein
MAKIKESSKPKSGKAHAAKDAPREKSGEKRSEKSADRPSAKASSGKGGDGGGGKSGGGGGAPAHDRNIFLGEEAGKLMRVAGGIGVAALAVSVVLGFNAGDDLRRFSFSYLVSFMWMLAICLGALWWVTLQHLVGAKWSVVARRVAEMIAAAMPVVAVLSLPIVAQALMGKGTLFPWADPHLVHEDHILHHKSPYLNPTFFLIRCVVYFGFWSLLALYWFKNSRRQDESGKPELIQSMRTVSAPAMIAIAVTLTFCAIDFMMSLDKLFFSTMWGVYYFAGCVICANSTLALVLMWLQKKQRLVGMVTIEHYHDFGKMMFAFIVFWSYVAFSQFMLIWYANMPEETAWFKPRFEGDWKIVSTVLLVGHFALPFLGLISRQIKRNTTTLAFWAFWLLAIHWVDMYWLIMPQLDPANPRFTALDITCWIGLGGVFIAAVAYNARKALLVPAKDPRLPASLAFENI